jgi:hypothetical protein
MTCCHLYTLSSYVGHLSLQRLHGLLVKRRCLCLFQPQALRNVVQPRLLLVRSAITKHSVHLFQALTPCLRDQEPRKEECDQSKGSKEDVCTETNGFQHIGRDKTDNEVAHPCR